MLKSYGCVGGVGGVGGPCDYCVSPSPFGLDFGTLDFGTLDFGTLDFGTSDLGLTIILPLRPCQENYRDTPRALRRILQHLSPQYFLTGVTLQPWSKEY